MSNELKGAGDLGNLIKNAKKLRSCLAAQDWYGALAAFEEIRNELKLGLSDVSFTSSPDCTDCTKVCDALDGHIANMENHLSLAPVSGDLGSLWLPLLLSVAVILLKNLLKK